MQPNKARTVDVLVIGARPAGLVSASYLSRYRRAVVVIDGGRAGLRTLRARAMCPAFHWVSPAAAAAAATPPGRSDGHNDRTCNHRCTA
jgi:thioredoxin reductase